MKIQLNAEQYASAYSGMFRGQQVRFCARELCQLGASGSNCLMTVRFKNPKHREFHKVHLARENFSKCWRWDSKSILPTCLNLFLHDTDLILRNEFPVLDLTVWVKF